MYQNNNYGGGGYRQNNYGGGYRNNNYGGGYQNNGYQNRPRPKKSGANYAQIGKGNYKGLPIVNAWLKTRQGLVTIKVAPYHKTKSYDSGNGNAFLSMIAEIKFSNGVQRLVPVLMNRQNKKIPIP